VPSLVLATAHTLATAGVPVQENNARGVACDEDEGEAGANQAVDDKNHEDDVRGRQGHYPHLPPGHQPEAEIVPGSEPVMCDWGGVRHVKGSEEWKRLTIPACELDWKCSMSANFRVVQNSAPNVTRHLFHSGPHMSMVDTLPCERKCNKRNPM
jgi:hypothetical protein